MVNRNQLVLGGALILVLLLAVSFVGQQQLSILSLSKVDFQNQGNKWVGSLVVNQSYERFEFACTGEGCEDVTIGKKVELSFRQLDPNCEYQVFQKKIPLSTFAGFVPIDSIDYLTLGGGVLRTPYNLAVYRDGAIDDTARLELEHKTDGSLLTPTTLSLVNGQVKLNQLGNLSGGIACPPGGEVALLWDEPNSQYKLVRLDPLNGWINDWQDALTSGFLGLPDTQRAITLWNTWRTRTDQMVPTGGWNDQVRTTNVHEIAQVPSGSTVFKAIMPKTSASALVQFEIDGDYSATYFVPQPDPEIVDLVVQPATFQQAGARADVIVQVRNDGEAGDVEVHLYNDAGALNFSPRSDRMEIGKDQVGTFRFEAWGLNPGNYTVRATATGMGSGLYDNAYFSGAVIDNPSVPDVVPGPVIIDDPVVIPDPQCGDGVCEPGYETFITCLVDCPILPPPGPVEPLPSPKAECLGQQGDGIFIIHYTWIDPSALGLIAGRCDPVYNWVLVAIIGMIGVLAIGGFIAVRRFK